MKDKQLQLLDTTLRDGAQCEGVAFSTGDKLKITEQLDRLGIGIIEAGNPSSSPQEVEFFRRAATLSLKKSRLAAFGATARKDTSPGQDAGIAALLSAGTEIVTIFGKSSAFHVEKVLNTTKQQNLEMIRDSVAYLKSKSREVIFDAEHYFDGYLADPGYAEETIRTAAAAGANVICLCDTNGGNLPDEIARITGIAAGLLPGVVIGIHCHNDSDCAVASTIAAVQSGATQVQGTFAGIGERCGNASLSSLIPNLQLKLGYSCLPPANMERLTETALFISQITNVGLPRNAPYVGSAAFSHKAGMHVDAVLKTPASFEHIPPEQVGNTRNILLSEMSGKGTLFHKIRAIIPTAAKTDSAVAKLTAKIKDLESRGYRFEAAAASFELLVLKEYNRFTPFFKILSYKIISDLSRKADAMVKIRVGDRTEMTADEGDGPVNAIDRALRKALERFYPELSRVRLCDYKVRILSGTATHAATAAITQVLIESTDGVRVWTTTGAGDNIISASLEALTDSIEYALAGALLGTPPQTPFGDSAPNPVR